MTFKKPFKAVPIRPKRLKGLDELNKPLWSQTKSRQPINWILLAVGLFIGVCLGLAYLFATGRALR